MRGEVALIVLLALAIIGGGLFAFKPKFLSGDSKRADQSQASTKKLEDAHKEEGASAAAGVTAIGTANTMAPDSPSKDFIGREIPSVLAKLPAPNPLALLEAEKRRVAVMEGKLELADKLYQSEAQKTSKLQADLATALEDRRKADSAISEAAAERLGAERQSNQQKLLIAVLVVLWGYTKLYGISPSTIGKIVADVRQGGDAVQAFDTHLAPWLHSRVRKASQLATPPPETK